MDDRQGNGSSTGDKGSKLPEEQPVNKGDTRPLEPLGWRDRITARVSGKPDEGSPPPAAVLTEGVVPPPRPPALGAIPSEIDETDRVRLVPRGASAGPWRLIMQTTSPGQATIGLNVWEPLVVGRVGGDSSDSPHLDLSAYYGREMGVSRQHAILTPGPDALYLTDVGSKNGTWINGLFLEPRVKVALKVGDRIEFGLFEVIVRTVSPIGRSG